jgi:hypothetical protein
MARISFKSARIDQTSTFTRRGSILGGTISSGASGFEVHIEIDSDEPPDRIEHLVRLARESCFTHGALRDPVNVVTSIRLNGRDLSS